MRPLEPLTAPVTAETALTRIAWLLERARAVSYRVEAFRNAARAVASAGATEIDQRAAAGTLTALHGIGKTTAAVINDAVAGRLPGYLNRLQHEAAGLPAGPGTDVIDAIRGDLHAHTDWSDGGSSIDEIASAAQAFRHDWLAITDHSPRLTIANGLDAQRLAEQIAVIDSWNAQCVDDFRLLRGIEVDILDDGGLDQSDAMLSRLDVMTASVHSKLRMDHDAMTERIVAAVSDPRVDVLGHCTGRRVLQGRGHRPPSSFDARAVFEACAAAGTAVEINSRPERVDPPDELIGIAVDLGCLFAIDSDAHAPGQLEFKALGAHRAADHGIDPDRIVTTWPLDRLLQWVSCRSG